MQYSQAGYTLTKGYEGLRLHAYQDVAGVWTIGYGSTVPTVHPGDVITQEEADARLVANMADAVQAVNSLVKVPLTQGQFDALVDFTYNLGQGTLSRSTLLAMVNRGDFAGAAAQFSQWVHAGGKVNAGLIRRRRDEAAMFTGGVV